MEELCDGPESSDSTDFNVQFSKYEMVKIGH